MKYTLDVSMFWHGKAPLHSSAASAALMIGMSSHLTVRDTPQSDGPLPTGLWEMVGIAYEGWVEIGSISTYTNLLAAASHTQPVPHEGSSLTVPDAASMPASRSNSLLEARWSTGRVRYHGPLVTVGVGHVVNDR